MNRPSWLGIVVVGLLISVPAFGQPWLPNCVVQWFSPLAPGMILVCPAGDGSAIDVTVRDINNLPLVGETVTAVFIDNRVCTQPISGITDLNGFVRLMISSGVNTTAGPERVNSQYIVTCQGVILQNAFVDVLSADYDCTGGINAIDFSYYAADWLKNVPRSDFNFAYFAMHWLHF